MGKRRSGRRQRECVCNQRGAAHTTGLLAKRKFTELASVSVKMWPHCPRAAGSSPPTLPARPRRTSAVLARRKQAVHDTDLSLQEQHPAFPGGPPGTAPVNRGGPQLLPSTHFFASEQCMIPFLSAVLSHACPQMGTLEAPGHLESKQLKVTPGPRPAAGGLSRCRLCRDQRRPCSPHRTSFRQEATLQGRPCGQVGQDRCCPDCRHVDLWPPLQLCPLSKHQGPVWSAPQLCLWTGQPPSLF